MSLTRRSAGPLSRGLTLLETLLALALLAMLAAACLPLVHAVQRHLQPPPRAPQDDPHLLRLRQQLAQDLFHARFWHVDRQRQTLVLEGPLPPLAPGVPSQGQHRRVQWIAQDHQLLRSESDLAASATPFTQTWWPDPVQLQQQAHSLVLRFPSPASLDPPSASDPSSAAPRAANSLATATAATLVFELTRIGHPGGTP